MEGVSSSDFITRRNCGGVWGGRTEEKFGAKVRKGLDIGYLLPLT